MHLSLFTHDHAVLLYWRLVLCCAVLCCDMCVVLCRSCVLWSCRRRVYYCGHFLRLCLGDWEMPLIFSQQLSRRHCNAVWGNRNSTATVTATATATATASHQARVQKTSRNNFAAVADRFFFPLLGSMNTAYQGPLGGRKAWTRDSWLLAKVGPNTRFRFFQSAVLDAHAHLLYFALSSHCSSRVHHSHTHATADVSRLTPKS
jgi:hypothetical protein